MSRTSCRAVEEGALADFNMAVWQVERLLRSVVNAGDEKVAALGTGVGEALAVAAERLETMREDIVRQTSDAARAMDEYVHEDPWNAIGAVAAVAGIVGLAVGVLLVRR